MHGLFPNSWKYWENKIQVAWCSLSSNTLFSESFFTSLSVRSSAYTYFAFYKCYKRILHRILLYVILCVKRKCYKTLRSMWNRVLAKSVKLLWFWRLVQSTRPFFYGWCVWSVGNLYSTSRNACLNMNIYICCVFSLFGLCLVFCCLWFFLMWTFNAK